MAWCQRRRAAAQPVVVMSLAPYAGVAALVADINSLVARY